MKKFITLFLLALLLSSSSIGFAEVKSPEWKDFCPPKYANVKYDFNDYTYHGNSFKETLLFLSIIGIPKFMDKCNQAYSLRLKKNEQLINNYWASKRATFEKELDICKSDPNNQSLCYLKVMEREENRNYREELKALAEKQMFMQSLNNMQSDIQAQQLNNNLKNINNSINNLNKY